MTNKPKFYRVGGFVRDKLLNLVSKDIDYAVEASSFKEMENAIISRGGEIFLSKPEFLTTRAKVPELGCADFVLCRKDGTYDKDGRRPDFVEIGNLKDDLSRRDATINALAEDENGNIIDYFNGREHLKQRLLVCVGNPEDRFREDSLRMLRFLRFSITKGLRIDYNAAQCMKNYQFVKLLDNISKERIREELLKMFKHNTLETIKILDDYSLIRNTIFDVEKFGIWLKPTLEEK